MEAHDPFAVSLAKEGNCDPRRPFGQALKQGCGSLQRQNQYIRRGGAKLKI
jgi:hypothetical protein